VTIQQYLQSFAAATGDSTYSSLFDHLNPQFPRVRSDQCCNGGYNCHVESSISLHGSKPRVLLPIEIYDSSQDILILNFDADDTDWYNLISITSLKQLIREAILGDRPPAIPVPLDIADHDILYSLIDLDKSTGNTHILLFGFDFTAHLILLNMSAPTIEFADYGYLSSEFWDGSLRYPNPESPPSLSCTSPSLLYISQTSMLMLSNRVQGRIFVRDFSNLSNASWLEPVFNVSTGLWSGNQYGTFQSEQYFLLYYDGGEPDNSIYSESYSYSDDNNVCHMYSLLVIIARAYQDVLLLKSISFLFSDVQAFDTETRTSSRIYPLRLLFELSGVYDDVPTTGWNLLYKNPRGFSSDM
jgi:hypothetical protein